ncbi:Asp-tRNA(Asn)/Glu-tRNA(Gln) amidotransferase subunit GatC [Brevibacterium sp. UMB1308A]|uniref:Asp-tRNA(Asn)/Glu-tRNA(Gln) amidotransferase subunit GatC n=1 Tax=Brevibacterium sp. UMB1308A TaxID=3050608 RepID=UPI002551BA25|nr:Asp-tRNA(Asn)/Glu-tRNA(Gln) amidotransferase subunit GatC [Brevibacterium sp. UMB1308A]MDK8347170.1 Asp-tRNA(Asn)/Glu-tRNA(Gln) amidotransferase subunit GatC [Brevibacterium sp. UMB1308B]MDK8714350.1 Asp-tRNA(Asn)/Glu-tRNA(Gln) amidotransferase subunit GatC [Brevibacterium sp. UMB1308A]
MTEKSAITLEQVEHLGNLARISMSQEELEQVSSDLGQILSSVAKVSEVATDDIPATSHPIPLTNVMRPDTVADQLTAEQALSAAPAEEDNKFLVPQILGED